MANVDIKVNLITRAAELQLKQLASTATTASARVKGFGTDFDTAFRQGSLALGKFGTIIRSGVVGAGLFGLVGAIRGVVNDFKEFESALIEIGKVADIGGNRLNIVGEEFQNLGKTTPVATNELINLGAAAARLGIRGTDNLLKFAEVGAKLGVATDVASKDAVNALARILTVTRESTSEIGGLGDALVRLGNNFAASESEILQGARVISQRAGAFGLAGREILGISTALKATGLASEISGSAIGTFFTTITRGASTGSSEFNNLAKILGVTTDALRKNLKDDAGSVLEDFVSKLGDIKKSGDDVVGTLDAVGLKEKRALSVFLTLAQTSEQFADALGTAKNASGDLDREAGAAFQSLESKLQLLSNAWNRVSVNVGKANEDILKSSVDAATKGTTVFGDYLEILNKISKQNGTGLQKELVAISVATLKFTGDIKTSTQQVEENAAALTKLRLQKKQLTAVIEGSKNPTQEEIELLKQTNREITRREKLTEDLEKALTRQATLEAKRSQASQQGDVIAQRKKQEQEFITEANAQILENEAQLQAQIAEQDAIAAGRTVEQAKITGLEVLDIQLAFAEQIRVAQLQQLVNAETDAQKKLDLKKKLAEEISRVELNQSTRSIEIQRRQQAEEQKLNQLKLSATRQLFGALASLALAGGKKTFGIYKAFAKAEALISGYQAVQNALATKPYFPVGVTLAAAAVIRTASTVAQINATQAPAFEQGGIVPGNSFTGDNVTARVNSGEMILNRQQQAQLFAQANGRSGAGAGGEVVVHTTVELDGAAVAKAVSRQVNNGTELGSLI